MEWREFECEGCNLRFMIKEDSHFFKNTTIRCPDCGETQKQGIEMG